MGNGQKKIILRRLDGRMQAGYLPSSGLLDRVRRSIDLLDVAGRMIAVPLEEVRFIAYVRDFNLSDLVDPERLTRRVFLARPRAEGLWVRLTFADGEVLEGLAALDLGLLADAVADEGLFLIPPDVRSNTQRLYVPRIAVSGMQVLAVVTTPSKSIKLEREKALDLPFSDPGSKA